MEENVVAAAEVAQIVLSERQGRDRGWWDQMAAAYWPDSHVNLTWYTGDGPGFVAGSRQMSGRGDLSVHRMSPPVVHIHHDRAWVEAPAAIELRTTIDGTAVDLTSYTRLSYRLERRGGHWKIASLDAIYERDVATAVVPGQVFAIPAEELAPYRPSYALLAWHLARRGYTIGTTLLGDDQPEPRDNHYQQARAWLRG